VVPPNYDSLVGKLICFGDDRAGALVRMRNALGEMVVEGIKTNLPLHQRLMKDGAFVEGGINIHYLESQLNG
jgi:acetyl-CoA carboxylase biotin carboxylase subunit